MIKTYLKHYMLDKTINCIFDGFIGIIHKPNINYTKHDFVKNQHLAYIETIDNEYVSALNNRFIDVYILDHIPKYDTIQISYMIHKQRVSRLLDCRFILDVGY